MPNAQLRLMNEHLSPALRGLTGALATQVGALLPSSQAEVATGGVSSFGINGTIAHCVATCSMAAARAAVAEGGFPDTNMQTVLTACAGNRRERWLPE